VDGEVRKNATPKRLLVLCPYPQGVAAGQRLKYEQYFDDWRRNGWDITVSCFMDPPMWSVLYEHGHLPAKVLGVLRGHFRRIRDLFRVRRFDLVYVFMWVTPFGTSVFERLTRRLAKRLVFDVEDNVLLGQKMHFSLHPNTIAMLLKGPDKAAFLIAQADHVITSSPFLNDECLTRNKQRACTYVTSSVDADRYVPARRYDNGRKVVVGWTGTFSSRVYLDLLRPVFQKLAKTRDFRLRVIGNFDYELDGVDLEVVRWTKENEIEDLQAFDIGVYPLAMEDWVFGKSGLKAIQYMAMALPTVATRVGMTPRIIENDVNGLLVETEDQWVSALERLIDEPETRRRLGAAARRSVEENYATAVVSRTYLDILETTLGRSAPGLRRSAIQPVTEGALRP
jgi:glycosyltransferase involved in cell wall biosynthesis